MSGSFAFYPYGLSKLVTVVASAGTVALDVLANDGTTTTISGTNLYRASSWRIANLGAANIFVSLGDTTETVALTTGMCVRGNTDIVIGTRGAKKLVHISAGTSTINITPGEGII